MNFSKKGEISSARRDGGHPPCSAGRLSSAKNAFFAGWGGGGYHPTTATFGKSDGKCIFGANLTVYTAEIGVQWQGEISSAIYNACYVTFGKVPSATRYVLKSARYL